MQAERDRIAYVLCGLTDAQIEGFTVQLKRSNAPDYLSGVAAFISERYPSAETKLTRLREDLADLLIAVGVTDDGTAVGILFRAQANAPVDHAALARQFAKISASRAPLDHPFCVGTVRQDLYAAARWRWPHLARAEDQQHGKALLRGRSTKFLSACDPKELNELALGLARYHQSFVRRQRPTKDSLDTLLEALGDIYASVTDYPWHRHHLPHSVNSRFVQFCRLVMEPFFDPSEVTSKAISNRWKRLKDDARRPSARVKRLQKPKLRHNKRSATTKA